MASRSNGRCLLLCFFTVVLCLQVEGLRLYSHLELKPPPLAILSVDERKGHNFVFETLSSFLLATRDHSQKPQVHIFVGNDNTTYLRNLQHHENLRVHVFNTIVGDAFYWKRSRRNWKGGRNYLRCLAFAGEEGILIVEDDVIFSNDFWQKFQTARAEIEKDYPGQPYALDCYVIHWQDTVAALDDGEEPRSYVRYKDKYCCTQAMYYSKGAAETVHYLLYKFLKSKRDLQYDYVIAHAIVKQAILVFGTKPALVQHIGRRSSLKNKFHTTRFGFETENPLVEPNRIS